MFMLFFSHAFCLVPVPKTLKDAISSVTEVQDPNLETHNDPL